MVVELEGDLCCWCDNDFPSLSSPRLALCSNACNHTNADGHDDDDDDHDGRRTDGRRTTDDDHRRQPRLTQPLRFTFNASSDALLFNAEGERVSAAGEWLVALQYDGVDGVFESNLTVTKAR